MYSPVQVYRAAALVFLLTIPLGVRAQEAPWSGSHDWPGGGKSQVHATRVPYVVRASAASPDFDASYYHLQLDIRLDPNQLFGVTRVEGTVRGGPLGTLVLDFSSNMRVDSVRAATGGRLAYTHAGDALSISLPAPAQDGERVAVDVFYQGLPAPGGLGTFEFGRLWNGDPFVWTLSEPYGAREWWPSRDHPSDKADSVRVTVTVPEGMWVGSNGLLVSEATAGGRATFDWRSRYPISTYLVFFAAGVYEAIREQYVRPDSLGGGGFPILHYQYRGSNHYQGSTDSPHDGWRWTVDVMPVLEHWFGRYPFEQEKYGHAEFTVGGGMEHQTMSSMGGSFIGLVSHELAHQWFGDEVTLRYWPHLWLNEGFATYAEILYFEAHPDRYPGAARHELDLNMEAARRATGTLVVQDTANVSNLFNGDRVYAKGGVVLHMLRSVVGTEAFRQSLRRFVEEHSYGTAVTADFQRAAEEVSGRDLDAFFRQWVTEGTGYPRYVVAWGYQPEGAGYRVRVDVSQVQTPPESNVSVFEMPVTLAVQTAGGEERLTVVNDARSQRFSFVVDEQPTGLLFDPERSLLRGEVPVTLGTDGEEAPAQTSVEAVFPNPFTRELNVRIGLRMGTVVRLELYDLLGRRVRLLTEEPLGAGFQALRFTAGDLPSGLYYLRLSAGADQVTVPVVRL